MDAAARSARGAAGPAIRNDTCGAPGALHLPRRVPVAVEGTAVVALYAALTWWLFWPGFTDPARTLILSPGERFRWDMNLVVWIHAWGFHALTTDPAHLFDANIFHPARASRSEEHTSELQSR